MSNYRRAYVPGGTYFLTLVTYHRQRLFADEIVVSHLRYALRETMESFPFKVIGAVVLPEHLHFIWTLPVGDEDFSKRVGRLKVLFTQALRGKNALPSDVCLSRRKHRESNVWQRRFWEHWIRDEDVFRRHMDDLHFNPVKHGLVRCPHQWQYSSFEKWVSVGVYPREWACQCGGASNVSDELLAINLEIGE